MEAEGKCEGCLRIGMEDSLCERREKGESEESGSSAKGSSNSSSSLSANEASERADNRGRESKDETSGSGKSILGVAKRSTTFCAASVSHSCEPNNIRSHSSLSSDEVVGWVEDDAAVGEEEERDGTGRGIWQRVDSSKRKSKTWIVRGSELYLMISLSCVNPTCSPR